MIEGRDSGIGGDSLENRVRSAVFWRSGSQILSQMVMWAATLIVIRLLNIAVSAEVGDDRGEASADDLERAYMKLDAIADEVRDDMALLSNCVSGAEEAGVVIQVSRAQRWVGVSL